MNQQPPLQTTPKYTDYRLASDPRAGPLNLLKLHTSKNVDLTEFAPPVRLYRKRIEDEDPLADGGPVGETKLEIEEEEGKYSTDMKEKKNPIAVVDETVIAPYGNAAKSKTNLFRKKTRQVYQGNPEARKVREQEKQPWVLEDYDGSHSWEGKLEGGQQSNYVLLVFAEDGFRVVQASKWYKFTPKIQYTTLTLDEAEEQISKQQKKTEQNDRWLMRRRKNEEEGEEGVKEEGDAKNRRKLKLTDHDNKKKRPQVSDVDEMDFEEVFEDDEEGGFLPELQDEEAKESMERQKREARKDRMSDEEAEDEQNTNLTRNGKEMRKLVRKMEKNTAYESDDERDPYAQSGGEEDGSDMELEELDGMQKDQSSTSGNKGKKPLITKEKAGKTALSSNTATNDAGKRKLKPSTHGASTALPKKSTSAVPRMSSSTSSVSKSSKSSRPSTPLNSLPRGSTPIHSSSSSALAALRAGRSASPPSHTVIAADSKRKRQLVPEEDSTDQASTGGVKKVKLKLGNTVCRDRSMSMSPPPPIRGISTTVVSSKANSPGPSPPSPPSSSAAPATGGEINPVQFEQELVDLIGNNTFSTKDLILRYKKVLRNASSKELVVGLIKKVASSHSGYLTLRDEYKNKISR